MKSQKVRKDIFEVHKPSGQISSKLTKNGVLHQLTPIQFDTINYMCYQAREQIHKKYDGIAGLQKIVDGFSNDGEVFNFLSNQEFTMNLKEVSDFTDSYTNSKDRVRLSQSIRELKDITVEMGLFKKHNLMVESTFSLLRRYDRTTNSADITYRLEPEILIGWVFNTLPYSKLFLKIQTQLKNTYSKILYEVCKDYEKLNEIKKPLKLWSYILGIDSKSSLYVSTFKRDYINKAIKEINKQTDIFIDAVFSDKIDGEQFMVIKFHTQSCKLLEVTHQVKNNKFYNKSKTKLDNLVKNGYKVIDEEMWIEVDIKKNEDRYNNEIRIDTWSNETPINIKQNVLGRAARLFDDCEDPIVYIDNYILRGIASQSIFTKNPTETIDIISQAIVECQAEEIEQ